QGREEHGERQEMVRLGADTGSAGNRRAGEGLVPGAVEQEREAAPAGPEVLRDQAHQLRLRKIWLIGGAHASSDEVGQGGLRAAEVAWRRPRQRCPGPVPPAAARSTLSRR